MLQAVSLVETFIALTDSEGARCQLNPSSVITISAKCSPDAYASYKEQGKDISRVRLHDCVWNTLETPEEIYDLIQNADLDKLSKIKALRLQTSTPANVFNCLAKVVGTDDKTTYLQTDHIQQFYEMPSNGKVRVKLANGASVDCKSTSDEILSAVQQAQETRIQAIQKSRLNIS